MSGHTPGPWTVTPDSFVMAGSRPSIGVARIITHAQEFVANARLIAAAPELLALLKLLRDDWFEPHYGLNDIGYAALLRDRIRAAIAKAEGR